MLRATSGFGSVLIPPTVPFLGMLTARVACQKRCEHIYTLSCYFRPHGTAVTTRIVALLKRGIHCLPKTPTSANSMPSGSCATLATVGSLSVLKTTCKPFNCGYNTGRHVERAPVNLLGLKQKPRHLSELFHITFCFGLSSVCHQGHQNRMPILDKVSMTLVMCLEFLDILLTLRSMERLPSLR